MPFIGMWVAPTTKQVLHNNQPSVESRFAWGGLGGIDIIDNREGNVAEFIIEMSEDGRIGMRL